MAAPTGRWAHIEPVDLDPRVSILVARLSGESDHEFGGIALFA
jgi:hypothetical protein